MSTFQPTSSLSVRIHPDQVSSSSLLKSTSVAIMPPSSRGIHVSSVFGPGKNAFRSREKYLIVMVLFTFCCVCFIAFFSLPDKGSPVSGEGREPMNKVYRVYKGIQDVGRDLILPAPPIDDPEASDGGQGLNPNNNHHGVLDKPDPHKVEDKAKLLAQVELDKQIDEIRKRQQQQVLPKPNLDLGDDKSKQESSSKSSSSASSAAVVNPPKKVVKPASGVPLVQGGEDPAVRDKRDTVKAVSVQLFSHLVQVSIVEKLFFCFLADLSLNVHNSEIELFLNKMFHCKSES